MDERIDTKGAGVPVVVYNPLGWERSGEVRVKVQAEKPVTSATGAQIIETTTDPATGVSTVRLHVLHVPALGYKIVRLGSGKAAKTGESGVEAKESGNSISLESDTLRVTIDKQTGCITSLFGKKDNFESLAAGACGNQLQFFKDTPKEYDAWNIDPGTLDVAPMTIEHADSVELLKTAEPAVRVSYHWQRSKFVQTLSLSADGDSVNVDNQIRLA